MTRIVAPANEMLQDLAQPSRTIAMQVGFHLSNLFRYIRVNPIERDTPGILPLTNAGQQDITQLSLNDRRVARLGATLGELDELLTRSEVRTRLGRASAISGAPLGLTNDSTAATFTSDEEINTATTSYSPFGPVFTGSGLSTALPEISGVYDGSNGDDTLRFKVTRTGVHGASRISVKVFNSGGDQIKNITIQPWHELDREYDVGNGLVFTLGPGSLQKNDDFYMDVFASTPSAVDPDKPFDGTRNDRPNFDDGLSVSAGSFDINGVNITVNADDTLNDVVQRINDSTAGVDAVFDAGSERVLLTQRTPGSANDIVFANDTSGFIATAKLTGSSTPGLDGEVDAALQQVSRFAGVTAGSLRINGSSIAFDPAADSLRAIINRINDADIGVTASLINQNQRVLLRATFEGAPLAVDDQGTQLFDAVEIIEKTYKPRTRTGFSRSRTYEIADNVERASALLNEVFDPSANPANDSQALAALRQGIVAALRGVSPDGKSGFGIDFALDAPVRTQFASVERRELTRGQQRDAGGARRYFQGLAVSLRGALGAYQGRYGLNAAGVFLNATA